MIQEKIQKNFIVNNNNKIIHTWSLSSKWTVYRFIVNGTTGRTTRTKLSTLRKTNIFKYCALFCNKVLKYTCNKGILLIQIMDRCIFVVFRNYSPFNWRAKLIIYLLFLFILSHQTVVLCYLRSWNLLFNLASIKHTYISMVRQTITTS